jgi:hypothetical protein
MLQNEHEEANVANVKGVAHTHEKLLGFIERHVHIS